LWRTLAITRVYQLSSHDADGDKVQPKHFERMISKPLSPEQLYDSFSILASPSGGNDGDDYAQANDVASRMYDDPARADFIRRMRPPPGSSLDYRAGTLQALMLMNGRIMAGITAPGQSNLLGAVDAPFMSDDDRVEALFLATLARDPDKDERAACVKALQDSSDAKTRDKTLSSLLWALLNSTEFAFNN
jgi:hypothetical protein